MNDKVLDCCERLHCCTTDLKNSGSLFVKNHERESEFFTALYNNMYPLTPGHVFEKFFYMKPIIDIRQRFPEAKLAWRTIRIYRKAATQASKFLIVCHVIFAS